MKFFIPFENYRDIGGPTTFMVNLQKYLDRNNFDYVSKFKGDQNIFFPIAYDIGILKKIKQNGGKIIQRLDGIYYPSKHGEKYLDMNKDIKDIYLNYSDYIIFQSDYSRRQCFEMFGEKPKDEYTIIINGVDQSLFYPAKGIKSLDKKIIFITTGNLRGRDMLEPLVFALDKLSEKREIVFIVVGPIVDENLKSLINRPYIKWLGQRSLAEIAELLRQSHIFLYSQLNPPCPNSVIEAIACGLPVVGFDSGAMRELCYFSTELLATVSNDLFQKYDDFKPEKLMEKIQLAIVNYEYYRKLSLGHCRDYDFEKCGAQYIKVFEQFKKPNCFQKIILKLFSPDRIMFLINEIVKKLPSQLALKYLFEISKGLYGLEGQVAISYEGDVHPKHRHINYHKFFIDNLEVNQRVLDIGCSSGELTVDLAKKVSQGKVVGVELIEEKIKLAKEKYQLPNLTFIHGNALKDLPNDRFDVITLSNFLEHIEKRVEFLKKLKEKYQPKYFLIRVPMFERDWLVPLQEELKIDYRLDSTHYIEYRYEELINELKLAGLEIESLKINWGEYWIKAK